VEADSLHVVVVLLTVLTVEHWNGLVVVLLSGAVSGLLTALVV
jgi:hypothetical protein